MSNWKPIETAPVSVDEWRYEAPFEFQGDGCLVAFSEDEGTPLFLIWAKKNDWGFEISDWQPLPKEPKP